MKNSITMLSIALAVFGNAAFANTSKSAVTLKETNAVNVSPKHSFYSDLTGVKYVSYSDANLIASELGSLKKSSKTISDIIGEDLKVTEAVITPKLTLTRKKTAKKQTFKSTFKN